MTKEEMIQVISQHEVFSGININSVGRMGEILEYKTVSQNKQVFDIGDQPNLIYYLIRGSLTLKFPDNSKLDLVPGELIGEIGVLNGDFRLGALTANEDSELIAISGSHIFDLKYLPHETSLKIIRRLSKRVTNYLRSIQQTSTREIISKGETDHVEFKSTLRWNLKANKKDTKITHAILKTIAAFLNTDGGTLIVGVTDEGSIIGLEEDRFQNDDKLLLFLTNIIKSKIGTLHIENIYYHTEVIESKTILRVDIQAGNIPCYIPDDKLDHFYIRTGPSTTDMRISKVYDYIKTRFHPGKASEKGY